MFEEAAVSARRPPLESVSCSIGSGRGTWVSKLQWQTDLVKRERGSSLCAADVAAPLSRVSPFFPRLAHLRRLSSIAEMSASTSADRARAAERRPLLTSDPSPASTSAGVRAYGASKDASTSTGAPLGRSVTRAPVSDDGDAVEDPDEEDDDVPPPPDPVTRRRTLLRWFLVWSIVSGVTVFLIVQAFRRGGGEFDWKGALKKAGGGVRPLQLVAALRRRALTMSVGSHRVSQAPWRWSSKCSR